MSIEPFKLLLCLGCGFSYDEALGLPEHGLSARHPLGGHPRRLGVPGLRHSEAHV